ncbi:hypothetical protein VTN00DRAFT_2092 [Thermoascus crustaceus]|uniref:uncharacterized protein n=1 Tax=Thermoascus crustaceus TaxID=5088 RepID=UPI0037427152
MESGNVSDGASWDSALPHHLPPRPAPTLHQLQIATNLISSGEPATEPAYCNTSVHRGNITQKRSGPSDRAVASQGGCSLETRTM